MLFALFPLNNAVIRLLSADVRSNYRRHVTKNTANSKKSQITFQQRL